MLLLGILTYVVLFVGLMVLLVKVAPIGYEDENGFHYEGTTKLTVGNNVGTGIKRKAA